MIAQIDSGVSENTLLGLMLAESDKTEGGFTEEELMDEAFMFYAVCSHTKLCFRNLP
jgi:hypothetical protein